LRKLLTAIDGAWANWNQWSNCDLTCDNGTTLCSKRSRSCTNPAPAQGGDVCQGPSQETIRCLVAPCVGKHFKGYSPAKGGDVCQGLSQETIRCLVAPCVGKYCKGYSPAKGGDVCQGPSQETIRCMVAPCVGKYCKGYSPAQGGDVCQGPSQETIRCLVAPCVGKYFKKYLRPPLPRFSLRLYTCTRRSTRSHTCITTKAPLQRNT